MAHLTDEAEIYKLYTVAVDESRVWRKDYHEFERLAENELLDDLDENLPEVNDGSLAASLFKLPKRIVNTDLKGHAKPIDRDDAWLTEIANMQWENVIIPNANSQAPFTRKWKDGVRKAGIYGSVPIISLLVERGNYIGADFIVAQPQDVTLEPGKVSDYDSDIIFWDVYFTDLQLESMIEQADKETKEAKKSGEEGYNTWNIPALKKILAAKQKDERSSQDDYKSKQSKAVEKGGYKFCIAFQRGVDAPFYMYHKATKTTVRKWSNTDPSGDIPIHFLYCYQDFINPYGIGIVKLAGGTQNVLDYMRQADVLATQLGFRPPISISGDTSDTDLDSIIYAQDQQWLIGSATVKREEISNEVYRELPGRVQMYKTSLNQLIPVGDTSATAAQSGDPTQSKTPAGVKLAAANLSIDDEDFKDNLNMTYKAVAKSMINIHFANMQGKDLMKVSDEEREILIQAGIDFPQGEDGVPSNQFELEWDKARAEFDFEIDPDQDKAKDDEKRLEGLLKVAQFRASDQMFDQKLAASGKKLNDGELYSEIIKLTSDNDKIIEDVKPDDNQGVDPQTGQPMPQGGQPAAPAQAPKTPSESLNYKDAPEDIKRQIEAQAGLTPSQMTSPVQAQVDQKQQQLDQAAEAQTHSQIMSVAQHVQNAHQPNTPVQPTTSSTSKGKKTNVAQSTSTPVTQANQQDPVTAIMQAYGVDINTANAMLQAESQGFDPQEIIDALKRKQIREGANVQAN